MPGSDLENRDKEHNILHNFLPLGRSKFGLCVYMCVWIMPMLQYVQFWRNAQSTTVAQRRVRVSGIDSKMAAPRGHKLGSSFLKHVSWKWQSRPLKCQSFLPFSPSDSLEASALLAESILSP